MIVILTFSLFPIVLVYNIFDTYIKDGVKSFEDEFKVFTLLFIGFSIVVGYFGTKQHRIFRKTAKSILMSSMQTGAIIL